MQFHSHLKIKKNQAPTYRLPKFINNIWLACMKNIFVHNICCEAKELMELIQDSWRQPNQNFQELLLVSYLMQQAPFQRQKKIDTVRSSIPPISRFFLFYYNCLKMSQQLGFPKDLSHHTFAVLCVPHANKE